MSLNVADARLGLAWRPRIFHYFTFLKPRCPNTRSNLPAATSGLPDTRSGRCAAARHQRSSPPQLSDQPRASGGAYERVHRRLLGGGGRQPLRTRACPGTPGSRHSPAAFQRRKHAVAKGQLQGRLICTAHGAILDVEPSQEEERRRGTAPRAAA